MIFLLTPSLLLCDFARKINSNVKDKLDGTTDKLITGMPFFGNFQNQIGFNEKFNLA